MDCDVNNGYYLRILKKTRNKLVIFSLNCDYFSKLEYEKNQQY